MSHFSSRFAAKLRSSLVRCYCYKPVSRTGNPSTTKPKPIVTADNTSGVSLPQHLQARIRATGPLTVADYMREILTSPAGGYYMNRDVFGGAGDFITSPEIGQIFGEMIAVWCLNEWEKIGPQVPLQVIELGPGRGTLMQDILRVFAHFKLSKEVSLHLVEVSPFLSQMQSHKLCLGAKQVADSTHHMEGESASGVKIYWHRQIEDVPPGFCIVLAHEFFDALPVHKLVRQEGRWKEMLVDVDPAEEGKFRFIVSRDQTPVSKLMSAHISPQDPRDHIEVSLESCKVVQHLAQRLQENGGFSLIVDYGHFGEKGDTFRAFKQHQLHDPLIEPGSADLTADVDFQQLKVWAEDGDRVVTFGPVTQRDFIKRVGGDTRIEVLCENATEHQREQLRSGYDMLTATDKMGERFKFFCMFPAVLREHLTRFPVAGFA